MHTVTPLAALSLGQAILTWTRQALAVRLDTAAASRTDIIIFGFIRFFLFVVTQAPRPTKNYQAHPGKRGGVAWFNKDNQSTLSNCRSQSSPTFLPYFVGSRPPVFIA